MLASRRDTGSRTSSQKTFKIMGRQKKKSILMIRRGWVQFVASRSRIWTKRRCCALRLGGLGCACGKPRALLLLEALLLLDVLLVNVEL